MNRNGDYISDGSNKNYRFVTIIYDGQDKTINKF